MNDSEIELVGRAIQLAAHPTLKWEEFDAATHALWFREAAAAIAALDQARSGQGPAPVQDPPLSHRPLSGVSDPIHTDRGQGASIVLSHAGNDRQT